MGKPMQPQAPGQRNGGLGVPIVANLDVQLLAQRGTRLTAICARLGITVANLSNLKTDKARTVRLATLESICGALECQPGDLIEYVRRQHRVTSDEATPNGEIPADWDMLVRDLP